MISSKQQHSSPPGKPVSPEYHRVLVVDDEPAICFAYRKLLESELFNFDICESIEAAIILLNQYDYFAVISDVRFSGSDNKDGVYFLSVVRKVQPKTEVILVTGYGSDDLQKTARALGATHYFEKPVKPSLILSLLRALHIVADKQEEAGTNFNNYNLYPAEY